MKDLNMKKTVVLFALSTMFISGAFAQTSSNGFSVGGVGELGGTAVNPVTENGWSSLNDYRAARDCCGYTNTGTDAQLWTDASNADAGSTAQIANANCGAATYNTLRTSCTNGGGTCQSLQRDTFLPMRDFNQQNPCLSPGYASYSDYQSAVSRGFGLNQLDITLITEADTTAWDSYCPGSDCSTVSRSQFLDAKSANNLFQSALVNAATATLGGSLTWSQLVANYGSYKVEVSAPWNTEPEQGWLMAYLNSEYNNSSMPMASAAHPSNWKAKVDLVTANGPAVALWIIQQIQAGTLAKSFLTADLLTTAGISSSYTTAGVVTQVANAIDNTSLTQQSDVANVSTMESWIAGLITTVWDASPNTAIARNDSDVTSSGAPIVTSSATPGGGGSVTYSLSGEEGSSFSVSSSGAVTTASSLSIGTFAFNVVATPSVGNAITKGFTLTVADATPPAFSSATSASNFANNVSNSTTLYTAAATDAGSAVTYSISGISGLGINVNNGVVTRTGSVAHGSNKSFVVTAADSAGNSATQTVSIASITFGWSQKKVVDNKCGRGCCNNGWVPAPRSVVDSGALDSMTIPGGSYSIYMYTNDGRYIRHLSGYNKSVATIRAGSWSSYNTNSCVTSSTCATLCVK